MRRIRDLIGLGLLLYSLALAVPAHAGAGIAAVWQDINDQLEVFWVDSSGAVAGTWKANNGAWEQPHLLAPSGAAPPNANLTAVGQAQDGQLQVYWLDGTGTLKIAWKSQNGRWQAPRALSGPGFGMPGAPVAAVWQPVRHEMLVFAIDGGGKLNMAWNKDLNWQKAAPQTISGFGVPGSQITAVYQPENEHVEVFAAGPNGAINVFWKAYDEKWTTAELAPPGTAPPGAALSGVYQALHAHLEVFFIGADGSYNTMWRGAGDDLWRVAKVSGPGFAPSGAPVSAALQSLNTQIEVFAVGGNGAINDAWKAGDTNWNAPFAAAPPNAAPTGAPVQAVYYPKAQQLEVFWQGADGTIWGAWKSSQDGVWRPPFPLTGAKGQSVMTKDACLEYFSRWYYGKSPADLRWDIGCQPFAVTACTHWRVSGQTFFAGRTDAVVRFVMLTLQRFSDVKEGHQDDRKVTFSAYAAWSSKYPMEGGGGSDMSFGGFDQDTGSFTFRLGLRSPDERSWRKLQQHNGHLVGLNMSGPRGSLYGVVKGNFYTLSGVSETGEWSAPATETVDSAAGYNPYPLVCPRDKIALKDPDAILMVLPKVPPPPRQPLPAPSDVGVLPRVGTPPPVIAALPKGDDAAAAVLPRSPDVGAGVDFTGTWTTTVQNGKVYALQLTQSRSGQVDGSYDAGTISDGVVVGSDLFARWQQGGASGTLKFSLSSDHAVFAGIWAQGNVAPTPESSGGTWDGYRNSVFTGPSLSADFTGTWNVSRGIVGFPVALSMNQGVLAGDYVTGFANGTISGQAARAPGRADTFSFTYQEPPSKGTGAFYLYPDGSRIAGVMHAADKAFGTWVGVRAAAPVVANVPPPAQAPQEQAKATQPPMETVKIPQGACPGPEAVARQQANVRNGSGGAVLKPPLDGGTLVTCIACDDSWCLIANANPHATVSRKFLDFDFATAQQAPPQQKPPAVQVPPVAKQPPQDETPPAKVADFSGEWHVISSKGWAFHMTFSQAGDSITGTFVDQAGLTGRLKGAVSGSVYAYTWDEEGGYTGRGGFTMSPDGGRIDGDYNVDPHAGTPPDLLVGTWSGTRGFQPFPAPPQAAQGPVADDDNVDFGGCAACGTTATDNGVK